MKTRKKRQRIVLPIILLCLLFLALIWVNYFRQKSFDRRDAIQFAIERNSNLAVALEQYAISTLHNADAVLQLVRTGFSRDGAALDLRELLSKNVVNDETIVAVGIINDQGRLVMNSTDTPIAGEAIRSYVKFHLKNHSDSLLISKPVISDVTGKPYIAISRRLNGRDGAFAGVVVVQVAPSTFTSFYAQAKLLPNDIISLIAPDGLTYARRTGNKESSGEDIHKSPLFYHLAHDADSFYFASDAIKNIPSWFSYRKLKNYPIIATVGSSEGDILAEYAGLHSRTTMPRIITTVLILLFSVAIGRVLLLRQRAAQRLEEEKERYERLLTEQVIAVQERERERIGRELHDNVSQVLTTVKLYLEMASKHHADPLLPRSMELISTSIVDIRNLSHQLSAPTLGTGSLIDSINALIEMVGFSTAIVFQFDHEGDTGRLVMSQKLALYRIVQEQLNNIIKHAAANKVWISLRENDDNVVLTVTDNGKGFDSTKKTNGMGLNNMISRANVFGGRVKVSTAPQQGCSIMVHLPIVKTDVEEV
jgi:signal transduction histidine kinase